ncbi:MAG TPA: ABC transporter substrate-binding protein, partial [Limnochordia bacterium]
MRTRRDQRVVGVLAILLGAMLLGAGAEAARPGRAERLNIAIPGRIADPTNFNIYAPSVSRSNTGLHQMIYEYFFYYNLETGEYIPWLAEDYQYGEGFRSITVRLRPGVTWSDGEPFTAEDVVFTYELLLDNPGMVWASEVAKWVDSVRALDERTVEIRLKQPNPRFHLIREAFPAVGIWGGLTILPKHIWEGKDPLTFKNYPPVGTGPYRLASASETAILYERRADWWGEQIFGHRPAPAYVNFQYYGPETSVAIAFAANALDTPNIGILSLGSFREIASRNPNVIAWHDGAPYAWLDPCPRGLMVQNAHAPWNLKEARWALSYLIDREQIVDLAYEGTTTPAWGIWPDYGGLQPYFQAIEDLIQRYPTTAYDPEKSAELFRSLGFTKGADGVWVTPQGARLAVTYLVNADSAEEMKVSAVLADQLRAGGIDVRVQPLSGAVLSDAILRGQYDIKLHSICPGE